MSRLYGELKGSARTPAKRRAISVMEAHIAGWTVGVRIVAQSGAAEDDRIYIYTTPGKDSADSKLLGVLTQRGFEPCEK